MQDHLEQTIHAFKTWRQTKNKPARQIPDALKAQAVALLAHCKAGQIVAALGLNGSDFKKWREQFSGDNAVISEPQDFISLLL